jgi:predicted dehydrogenase
VAERIHLPAIGEVPSVELVGACEPDAPRREKMGRRFGIRALYTDAAHLLEAERPDIVIIGSPPDSHHNLCLLALAHGAHVFCEKPFVGSAAEADEVVEAATRQGRRVAVNNQYRYMPIYRRTRERLAQGEFGHLFLIQCWEQMFHPPSKETNWRAGLVRSTLYEFGTHALDLICYFFDALPQSVAAHTPHPWPEIAADVVVVLTLRFPGERVATMVLNRISHAPQRYFEMRLDCTEASLRLSLGGVARLALDWSASRLVMRASFVRGGEARVERNGRSTPLVREYEPAFASATAQNLKRFVESIERGEGSNEEARYARDLIRVVFSAYESADTGRTIWLNDAAHA